MDRTYRTIDVLPRADVFCVRLRSLRMVENELYELSGELSALINEDGCRKLALSLGPGAPECLYSVFLAKLIALQRQLGEKGGRMVLCEVSPEVRAIFDACQLGQQFHFAADFDEALQALAG